MAEHTALSIFSDAANLSSAPGLGEKPVRVLHVIGGKLYGGVETLLATLARLRHLCPGMEPEFAVCYDGRLANELQAAGVPVHLIGSARLSRPWTTWRARRRLRSLLERERFDLVICHMAWSMALFGGTARKLGSKLAFWAHGFQSGENVLERMARRVNPDLVISNSRSTAGSISTLWSSTNNHMLYYPVALTPLAEAAHWRSQLRRAYGVPAERAVIIQVSRLEPWKGHRLHLRALSALKDMDAWECWFVGGPQNSQEQSYFEELQSTANQLGLAGRIRFLGQRSDVAQLLAAADIFSQPNAAPEPFGIVFIEALWAGLPVVSTALGGALEIVNETCGFLVKPDDAEALAQPLRCLIESPELRRRLGQAGPGRAVELCDPAPQMRILEQLTRQVSGSTRVS
jgi:glycosyltransferase involved in cell wall biosynthesis